MPVQWSITGVVICDVCGEQYHIAGATQAEAVSWLKQARWTYRWSTATDERRLIVRCPRHPETYDAKP